MFWSTFTGPDGSTNTYNYDGLGRLTDITNSWAGHFGFGYDTLSRRTQMTRPNGVATGYNYDNLSRLLSVLHGTGPNPPDGFGYGYDNAGNRTSKKNLQTGVDEAYGYDALYQLKQVTQTDKTAQNHRNRPTWDWLPTNPKQTNCVYAVDMSLEAGGVPVSDNDWPGNLGDELDKLKRKHTPKDPWNVQDGHLPNMNGK